MCLPRTEEGTKRTQWDEVSIMFNEDKVTLKNIIIGQYIVAKELKYKPQILVI